MEPEIWLAVRAILAKEWGGPPDQDRGCRSKGLRRPRPSLPARALQAHPAAAPLPAPPTGAPDQRSRPRNAAAYSGRTIRGSSPCDHILTRWAASLRGRPGEHRRETLLALC